DGHENLEATPPLNTLTIPLPADPERFFALEAFPAPPNSLFSDDLENGIGEWTVGSDGADGTTWELGRPTAGPGAANSGTNCFATNLGGEYGLNANAWLRSPPVDLSTIGEATLRYAQFVDIEEGFASTSVQSVFSTPPTMRNWPSSRPRSTAPRWNGRISGIPSRLPPSARSSSSSFAFSQMTSRTSQGGTLMTSR
ncbi:MAG: hypothetical protein GWO24_22640, partial [Akkermansiaceae bacterium]|nr:hypothetical protein [Akkermansiaceae bacterium]